MKPILLIHPPSFDAESACVGGARCGIRVEPVSYWEQISELVFRNDGYGHLLLNGLSLDRIRLVMFAGYPEFAVQEFSGLPEEFARAEWIASLDTFLYSMEGVVANRRALKRYISHHANPLALLPLLASCGWHIARTQENDPHSFHIVLSRWRVLLDPTLDPELVNATQEALVRFNLMASYVLMTQLGLDQLFLRLSPVLTGVTLTGAYITPPRGLTSELWTKIWYDVLPLGT